MWSGLLEGLYNVKEALISDACLNKVIAEKMIRIESNAIQGESFISIIQTILDGAAVINNFNECGIE